MIYIFASHLKFMFKKFWQDYKEYFVDFWQYIVIILIMIIAAIFIL